jgi:hypothetical protein
MRLSPLLLGLGVASLCISQTLTAPIPADPHELVTGIGKSQATGMDRAQAVSLLNRSKNLMRLHAPTTPPHLLTMPFSATSNGKTEIGEFTEFQDTTGQRWTAKLGTFSMARDRIRGEAFDETPVSLLPMRIHMLRNTIFWAAGSVLPNAQFRSAPAEWNNRPVTCLLMSERPGAAATLSRRWDESEYCIDDQSGLIQILSFAPGNYTVYSYGKDQSFHGNPIPDRIVTYIGGTVAIDANFRLDEPSGPGPAPTPTAEMLANPRPIGLQDPVRQRIEVSSTHVGGEQVVIVNTQVGPDGKPAAQEVCAASDLSLAPAAMERVNGMRFGESDAQRQFYVEVRFAPPSSVPAPMRAPATPVTMVPLAPYYLERNAHDPNGGMNHREILARRSDGALLRISGAGPAQLALSTRDLEFPDGRHVTVFDSIKAKVTWPMPGAGEMHYLRARRTEGPGDCAAGMSGKLLRHDQVEGQDVDVVEMNAGTYRLTNSMAPKLGCESLYVKSESPARSGGSFQIAMETKTTKLIVGEPDPGLFEVAPGLEEMKPSEAQTKLWESADLGLSPEDKASMLRQMQRQFADEDRRYAAKRQ